jgi:hypothetical protein
MSTRRLRASLDRLEEVVRKRQANGTLCRRVVAPAGYVEMPEDIRFLEMKRLFGLPPEEKIELERWEAEHPRPRPPYDPNDPWNDIIERLKLSTSTQA